MKKLSKLSISILSLGAIATSTIPLAACNKANGIKVTEEEWEYALAYLAATVEGATWKSTSGDSFEFLTYNSEGEQQSFALNELAFNDEYGVMSGSQGVEGRPSVPEQLVSIARGNMYFTYSKGGTSEDWGGEIQEYSVLEKMLIVMIAVIGGQEAFTFDNSTGSYVYKGDFEYVGLDANADISIKFNSDKKISNIKYYATATDKTTKRKEIVFDLKLNPQYSDVEVNVPAELITKANDHTLDVSGSKTVNLPSGQNNNVIVNLTSDSTYTTITAIDDGSIPGAWEPVLKGICKNGEHILEETDYTLTTAAHQMKIVFTEPLQKNDVVNFAYTGYQSQATTLTITLSN